jgi:molecular chaperone GrpE
MSKHRHDSESAKDKNANPASTQTQSEGLEQPQAFGAQSAPGQSAGNLKQDGSQEPPAGPFAQEGRAGELEAALKENASLKSEVEELNAKYLRKLAEEVNFRKRMLREKEDGQKYALSSILADLVSVLDDFDRGMNAATQAHSFEQLHEGMVLVQRQLSQMLENKYA